MSRAVLSESTRRVLEFDAVLALISGYAQSPLGIAAVRELAPMPQVAASEAHARVAETRALAARRGFVACGRAESLRAVLELLSVEGTVLDIQELGAIRRTGRVIAEARSACRADPGDFPLLTELVAEVPALRPLLDQLDRLLDDDDEMRDDASPELARIRAAIVSTRRRARERLERMVHDPNLADALQDPLVTERGGRLVVPVRSGQRDRVPGVVHDASSSGQTIFVEPLAAVEDQNRLAEQRGAEREEVRRLLAEASAHARAARTGLAAGCVAVAQLDALQALARWAEHARAIVPEWVPAGVRLRCVRHPLLEAAAVVPLDIEIDAATRALVITGPNTGGKTVALKVLGLAVAMAQSGIPVPAETASLPAFGRVHADIGDEQSLAASLSTFSGHLRNIVEFLAERAEDSLVLLDELGTGTDPTEGAALGIAIVERLIERGALVVVSTHHDALKVFAERTPAVVNAAMEFDAETLAPTYRLRIGRPGRSNALAIATRLGLETGIIERARELMADDVVQLDTVLRGLEEQERELEAAREELAARTAQLESSAESARRSRQASADQYSAAAAAARAAIDAAVAEIKAAGERRLAELDEAAPSPSARSRADRQADWSAVVGKIRRQALDAAEKTTTAAPIPVPGAGGQDSDAGPDGGDGPLVRGTRVQVRPFNVQGVVMHDWEAAAGDVEVDVGGKRMRVGRDKVTAAPAERARWKPRKRSYRPRPDVSAEIDLHGMRVEEALAAVDRHIDQAILAELSSVRLIHGFGTLRLRDAIQEHLRGRPEIRSLSEADPFSGGGGVTVVQLED